MLLDLWLMIGACSLSVLMLWNEKERSRIKTLQLDNLRGLPGIRRIEKVPNLWIRELHRVMKVFSDGSAMLRGWRMTGLLRGSMRRSMLIVTQLVGHGRSRLIMLITA